MSSVVSELVGEQNRKLLIELDDGSSVEAVVYRSDTLCISTQVGCAVRCPFCASGYNGLGRSLSFEELVAQVELVIGRGHHLKRLTLSGVGEPLHNHRACRALLEWARERSLGVSLTTSGGPLSRLREWLSLPHNGLTISVHSGSENARRRLVPKGPALDPLFSLLRDEVPQLNGKRRKKLALAYLLLAAENDSVEEIDSFVSRALPLGLRVHLYAYNPVSTSAFGGVERSRYEEVYQRMTDKGLVVSMSSQARIEALGGCGTLVALRAQPKSLPSFG